MKNSFYVKYNQRAKLWTVAPKNQHIMVDKENLSDFFTAPNIFTIIFKKPFFSSWSPYQLKQHLEIMSNVKVWKRLKDF